MTEPDKEARDRAAWINLSRHPETQAAIEFTRDTLGRIMPHLGGTRAIGAKGLASHQADLGVILAGLMRSGLQGAPVRAHQSSAGGMWDRATIGRDRFWRLADALRATGLLGKLSSASTPGPNADGKAARAALLWPSEALVEAARIRGVTADTRKQDWRSDPKERAKADRPSDDALLKCRPFKETPRVLGVTPAMLRMFEEMRADLRAINETNGAAEIRGAGFTVSLVRRFKHSAAFGGRFYAPVVNMSPEDRQRITINGEPVAEIDVKGSQLTVLLGIVGQREAPGDVYKVPGLPRPATKAWFTETKSLVH